MHLSGDRDASILYKKIGELLDAVGAPASAADIRAELGTYQFAWKSDDHPENLKRRIMDELAPTLNEIAPKAVTQLLDQTPDSEGRVWWVNQGSTFGQESAGGFLWAPVATKAGRPATHHTDLRKAQPGDVVIAYANTAIRALVTVSAAAIDAEKPGDLGSEWGRDGMLLKGTYYRLDRPIGITEIPERLRRPEVGPFNRDGRVNQGYFYAVARSAADELRHHFADRWPADSPWGDEAAISHVELRDASTQLGYSIDTLIRDTLWDESELTEVIDALRRHTGGQVILAGPPGTGKTWVAEHIARYLVASEGVTTTVQFHPSYGYEEFIEGLRPTVDEQKNLTFRVQPGVVRRAAAAMDDSAAAHVIVIDEMNRANLPRVFGELMYLFEYRDHPIDLQYTAGFALPDKLWFIGTMNTADRSIRSLDIALRRRFEVFECPPRRDILERFYAIDAHANDILGLYDGFDLLNAKLTAELDRHHTVGHTFFMEPHMTRPRLEQIWRRKIGPLIEEYFFDRPDLAHQFSVNEFWPAS